MERPIEGFNDKSENAVFQVMVDKTLRTTLDLLNRRRTFAVISTSLDRASQLMKENLEHRQVRLVLQEADGNSEVAQVEKRLVDDDNGCLFLLSKASPNDCDGEAKLLFVGEDIRSRDDESRKAVVRRQLEVYGVKAEELSFPTIRELYALAEGRVLEFPVYAKDEEEAIRVWTNTHLRMGRDLGRPLMNKDQSSMTLNFIAVNQGGEKRPSNQESVEGTDPAEFSSYHEMLRKMRRAAAGLDAGVNSYGDDDLVEFALSNGDEITRCICTRFFSNHNWRLDPTSLLVLEVKARILPEVRDADALRFSHPTKAAKRALSSDRYLLDSIVTDNNMKPKFSHTERGKEKKPDELVSADRVWDNLVDFFQWVDVYRKEIDLL